MPPAAQEQYQQDLKTYRDNYAVLKTARDEGEAKGKAEGKVEGKAKRSAEIARNLKKMGLAAADISKATGLSAAEVAEL